MLVQCYHHKFKRSKVGVREYLLWVLFSRMTNYKKIVVTFSETLNTFLGKCCKKISALFEMELEFTGVTLAYEDGQ